MSRFDQEAFTRSLFGGFSLGQRAQDQQQENLNRQDALRLREEDLQYRLQKDAEAQALRQQEIDSNANLYNSHADLFGPNPAGYLYSGQENPALLGHMATQHQHQQDQLREQHGNADSYALARGVGPGFVGPMDEQTGMEIDAVGQMHPQAGLPIVKQSWQDRAEERARQIREQSGQRHYVALDAMVARGEITPAKAAAEKLRVSDWVDGMKDLNGSGSSPHTYQPPSPERLATIERLVSLQNPTLTPQQVSEKAFVIAAQDDLKSETARSQLGPSPKVGSALTRAYTRASQDLVRAERHLRDISDDSQTRNANITPEDIEKARRRIEQLETERDHFFDALQEHDLGGQGLPGGGADGDVGIPPEQPDEIDDRAIAIMQASNPPLDGETEDEYDLRIYQMLPQGAPR